jgi:signal transduction histidine kinase
MSHEIRTPLNAILGTTALAQTRLSGDQRESPTAAKFSAEDDDVDRSHVLVEPALLGPVSHLPQDRGIRRRGEAEHRDPAAGRVR